MPETGDPVPWSWVGTLMSFLGCGGGLGRPRNFMVSFFPLLPPHQMGLPLIKVGGFLLFREDKLPLHSLSICKSSLLSKLPSPAAVSVLLYLTSRKVKPNGSSLQEMLLQPFESQAEVPHQLCTSRLPALLLTLRPWPVLLTLTPTLTQAPRGT